MLSRLRTGPASSKGTAQPSRIVADLAGAVITGQVAIGEHIVQIHADHGAIVNYAPPPQLPVVRLRPGPVRRLPRDFPMLLGRDAEVSAASLHTSAGESVDFFGPSGIGKTALLRHLAHRPTGGSTETVLFTWCGAQPVADLQQFVFECLYDCETPVVPTPAALAGYLEDQRALVILDDVELERADLDRLMDALPASVFVCGSPQRTLWGEGRAVELRGLGVGAAIALIERELGRPLAAPERAAAERLTERLQGHPLAIIEAAGVELGDGRGHRGPITASAGRLLEALAALPGVPVPTVDLAVVTGIADAARELEELEVRHLVQAHSPRFSLTGETTGAEDEASRRWRERFLAHFAGEGPGEDHARAERAAFAAPPILALLGWARDARRPADVLALARATDGLLALGCRWGAWGVTLEHALRAARSLDDRAAEAWALHQLGSRALCREDAATARAALTDALAIRERLGDEPGAALTRHNLGLLDGGAPDPPSNGGGWPRPPRLTLTILLAILALGTGASAAAILTGNHNPPPNADPSTPTTTTSTTAGTNPPATTTTNPSTTRTTKPTAPAPVPGAISKPDLVVGQIMDVDAAGMFAVVVQNLGDAPAEASRLGYTAGGPDMQVVTVDALEPHATTTVRLSCEGSGQIDVSAVADAGHTIDETDEQNNTAHGTVTCKRPDLKIDKIVGPGVTLRASIRSAPFTVTAVVHNIGQADAPATSTAISAQGAPAVMVDTPALAVGESTPVTITCAYEPQSATATADANRAVTESDEANNDGQTTFYTVPLDSGPPPQPPPCTT